ncbi:MAG TPA: sigma-70 family RNA polymerase sigma factor [Promineifilum sp.]|nr:sigma-70 family RNA polymerase sigma factor [Promineifilum sp.]HRO22965.1 sigma-70 family RNA polymerase sigma factor [Promineifilum sp.]HRO91180.1 sigma-70 family RNA polymerase sigma factor [Promineifilum sp.]HRQ13766.1 sigma-70 family RNA polymerase sigma factor [Promineifilum sp.]
MSATNARTNEQWVADLGAEGPAREAALADLRVVLANGLRRGLIGQVDTSAPEFDVLIDDFIQDALLKILENLDTFAGRSLFTTWANKVALNIGLTELRRKRWRDTSLDGLMQTEEGEFTPSFVADPAPRPEELTERKELMGYVNHLINEELTEKQRTALTAAVIQGRPLSEVAWMMDSNQNAVYKLVFDARQRLRRRLAEDNLTPEDILASFVGR